MCLLGFRRVCALCALSFLLSSIRLLASSSLNETISRHQFSVSALSLSSKIDATRLFKALRLRYCTEELITFLTDIIYNGGYCTEVLVLDSFTIGHKIMPILHSAYYRSIATMTHPFCTSCISVTTHLQFGRLTRHTL